MRRVALLAAVVAVVLGLAGCGSRRDPCATLPPPTPANVQSALQGAEVERELGEVECVVVVTNGAGSWVRSTD